VIVPYFYTLIVNITKPQSNIIGTYKSLRAQFESKSEISKSIEEIGDSEDPDVIFDTLLGKLTNRQLVILVKKAIEQGVDLIGTITKMMEANLALETARASTHAVEEKRGANAVIWAELFANLRLNRSSSDVKIE